MHHALQEADGALLPGKSCPSTSWRHFPFAFSVSPRVFSNICGALSRRLSQELLDSQS